jgi:hypothetical protein
MATVKKKVQSIDKPAIRNFGRAISYRLTQKSFGLAKTNLKNSCIIQK